jgi:hypothetical protein
MTQPNFNPKNNSASDDHLPDRGPEVATHEPVADEGDRKQFSDYNCIDYIKGND